VYDADWRVTDVQPENTPLLNGYDWHHCWYDEEWRTGDAPRSSV
jgi:hypothetical protein